MPLALLLGVRTGEAGREEALLDEPISDPGVRLIQPAALSGLGIAQLVERALGAAPDAAFLSAGVSRRPATRRLSGNSARAVSGDRSAPARVGCPAPVSNGELLDDPDPESAAFWGLSLVLVMGHAYEDAGRVCSQAIEWATRQGSQPAFALHAQLRAFAWGSSDRCSTPSPTQ